MIDLHLSAFAPRWRFLYAVRIDAYIIKERSTLLPNLEGPHFLRKGYNKYNWAITIIKYKCDAPCPNNSALM